MKFGLICGAVLAAVFSVSANAQSCTSPAQWAPDTTGSPPLQGDTCSAAAETGIVSLCGGNATAYGHAYVLKYSPTAEATYTTITLSGVSGFSGYIGVVKTTATGACNGGGDTGNCVTSGDAATPIQSVNVPAGSSYYLIVSNSGASDDASSCGTFTLTANGTLPVSLQSFTVG